MSRNIPWVAGFMIVGGVAFWLVDVCWQILAGKEFPNVPALALSTLILTVVAYECVHRLTRTKPCPS
ncbi:MAG TPA: hypothetical protein VFI95_09105, partial [Terriglobales bacterium]|nr:hypothetical protein [Terriglobales bacterium]